jgi:ribosomal protein S27E
MSSFRCRMPHCDGQTWQMRGVCDDCYFARTTWLREMPAQYAATYVHLGPGTRHSSAEAIRLPSVFAAAPINMAAYDAMHYAGLVVDTWAQMARWQTRRTASPKTWSGAAFVANVKVLARDDRRITSSYVVGDYVHDLFCAYHGLTKIAAAYESKRLPTPCPECDSVSVLARNAGEYARCLTCGVVFSHARLHMLDDVKVVS